MIVTVAEKVKEWEQIHAIGRKPRTRQFNREIARIVLDAWPNPSQLVEQVTFADVLEVSKESNDYCPSRWNAIVGCIRFITPEGMKLKKRKLRFRQFNPPSTELLNEFLRELDLTPKSDSRWMVRLLLLTGMRINEARNLKWTSVFPDHIEVEAAFSKNGKRRSIPLLPGCREVLNRLREAKQRGTSYRNGKPFRGDYVFKDTDCRSAIKKACLRLGMPVLSYHCFRHIFLTKCVESQIPVPLVARLAGHSDGGALLARMYYHVMPEFERQMVIKAKIF